LTSVYPPLISLVSGYNNVDLFRYCR